MATRRITNGNLYLEGTSFLGSVEEINVPEVKFKKTEHKAAGMFGSYEFSSGVDKLEGSIKWNQVDPEAMKLIADPTKVYNIMARCSQEVYDSQGLQDEEPVVYYMAVQFSNVPGANIKQHDNVELSSTFSCTYIKLEVAGVELYEYDALANIYKVAGVDKLEKYRANLGI